jgi:hypothetical protein
VPLVQGTTGEALCDACRVTVPVGTLATGRPNAGCHSAWVRAYRCDMSMHQGGAPVPNGFLVTIGSVGATPDRIVTPSGTWELANVNVSVQDQTATTTHVPAWAIVAVVLTVWFFLLGLLFLLARERRTQGNIAVTLVSGGRMHTEFIPVWNEAQRIDVFNRVGYLQNVIGQARVRRGL